MKMISSQPLDQPCEETGSQRCSSFVRHPLFVISYWSSVLVMTILILRQAILRTVCG